jgi:hypothetical protein
MVHMYWHFGGRWWLNLLGSEFSSEKSVNTAWSIHSGIVEGVILRAGRFALIVYMSSYTPVARQLIRSSSFGHVWNVSWSERGLWRRHFTKQAWSLEDGVKVKVKQPGANCIATPPIPLAAQELIHCVRKDFYAYLDIFLQWIELRYSSLPLFVYNHTSHMTKHFSRTADIYSAYPEILL